MKRSTLLTIHLIFIVTLAACGGGDGKPSGDYKPSDDIRVYVVTVEVVDEDGLPVNKVNVAGGDIFGSTEQGGTLERSMVDEGQFRQHLASNYRVEKAGCNVDRQQVRIDETNNNLATITLHLACTEPVARLDKPPSALLFDGENIWITSAFQNTVSKVAWDGTVLGVFPVGDRPTRLAFDGENLWVAYASYDIPDVGPLKKLPDRDRLTKLDMNGRQVGNYRIELTDSPDSTAGLREVQGKVFDLDEIADLAFDGEGMWVSRRSRSVSKLALDGTELWTTRASESFSDRRLIFDGERMVILTGMGGLFTRFLDIFDLEGNRAGYSVIDINYKVDDAAFGGDGIWLAETRGITKIGIDGKILLGPFLTPMGGPIEKLVYDGQYIWVLEDVDNSLDVVSRLSQDGQVIDTFTVGISGGGLVSDGKGVWVTTGDDYDWSGEPGASFRIPTTGALWKSTPD